jgi:hypothetical protein
VKHSQALPYWHLNQVLPILPIGISGAHDRSKLVIKIGEPFLLSVDSRQKESLRIAGKEIMQRIDNLLIKGN